MPEHSLGFIRCASGWLFCPALFLILVGAAWGQLPEGPGKNLTATLCGECHGTDTLLAHRQSKEQWTQTMLKMIDLGAGGTEEQFNAILRYLAENLGPQPATVNVNKATAAELVSALELPAKQAEAIVTYRKENGDFKTAADLKKVPGLDSKKIEAVKDRLTFK